MGRGRRGGLRLRCIHVREPSRDADPEQDAPRLRLGGWRSGGSALSACVGAGQGVREPWWRPLLPVCAWRTVSPALRWKWAEGP